MEWNRPKSVRQIGDVPGHGRVYIEDYVIRFAKRIAGYGKGTEKAAMLLGGTFTCNGEKIYQISGIVEISGFAGRSGPVLPQSTWDQIYTEIKENFTDLEIVGWYYCCTGFDAKDASRLLEIHKQNFQHRDKVLYVYEQSGREDGFFLYRSGQFERQKGYYIYYEKNPEMLRYMEKENNRHVHVVEQEDDRVVRNIRGIMEEKERVRGKYRKRENRWSYSLGAVVAMIAILVGVATLRNQNTLNQVKEQMGNLQEMVLGEQRRGEESRTTTVETMGSNLKKATPEPASGEAVSASAVAK